MGAKEDRDRERERGKERGMEKWKREGTYEAGMNSKRKWREIDLLRNLSTLFHFIFRFYCSIFSLFNSENNKSSLS